MSYEDLCLIISPCHSDQLGLTCPFDHSDAPVKSAISILSAERNANHGASDSVKKEKASFFFVLGLSRLAKR